MLFDAIPAQLNKNASRYQVSSVLTNNRADNTLELIAELKDSKTVLVSYHANDPSAGMSTNKDLTRFKLFLCDTGLFTTLFGMFKEQRFHSSHLQTYEIVRTAFRSHKIINCWESPELPPLRPKRA